MFIGLELRFRGSDAIPLESRLLSWLFLFLGLYQFRYMSFFFLFSTVPLALHIDRLLRGRLNDFQVQKSLLAAGIVGACALPLTFVQIKPALALPEMLSEQDARYLQTHFSHARLLNNWNVGGLGFSAPGASFLYSWMAGELLLIRIRCFVTISNWRNGRSMRPPGTRCLRNTGSIRCFGSRRMNH